MFPISKRYQGWLRLAWKSRYFVIPLAVLGSLVINKMAQAQTVTPPPPLFVQMDAQAAFEGNFKYGEWLPIEVEIINNGGDIQAVLQAPVQNSEGLVFFSQTVELPTGAHKSIALYVLPNNYSRTITVELVSGNELLASSRVSLHPNPNLNYLVGMVTPRRGALSLVNTVELPGTKRTIVSIDVPLSQIPERFEGLRSFDLLIFNDTDTSRLSPAQQQALQTWASRGGRLVIGGGSSAALMASGLPGQLFQGIIRETKEVNALPALETFVGGENPIRVPGPFVQAVLETAGGSVLAGEQSEPLLYEWPLQSGFVNFIALDPAVTPFDAWNGTVLFWQKLISPGSEYPENTPTDISPRQQLAGSLPYALSNLTMLDLPSVKSLAIMLAVYILLVGPINYLVLRRLKRLQLAWVTIPAITLLFSAASFGLGYAMHGTNIFINKISIIQLEPGGSAHYDSFIGVFSPAQTSYRVKVEGDGLLSPLGQNYDPWNSMQPSALSSGKTLSVFQGDPAVIEGLSVDQWSMQSVMSEGNTPAYGKISADLLLNAETLTGTLKNETGLNFDDAFIVFGNRFSHIGPLQPGSDIQVNLDLTGLGSPEYNTSLSYTMFQDHLDSSRANPDYRKYETRRSLVESIFERTPNYLSGSAMGSSSPSQTPVFIGFTDAAPPVVEIAAVETNQQASGVVLQPLKFRLPGEKIITVPVGLIPGKVISYPAEGGTCGTPGMTAVYIARGESLLSFTLSPEMNLLDVRTLKLGVWSDSGALTAPKIEFYNWKDETWLTLDGVNLGANLVPDAKKFINDIGSVRVRLSADQSQSCFYLALGLEGARP